MFPVISSLFLVISSYSFAASGEGVPVSFILFQTLNFLIFLGISIYLFLKHVPGFVFRQYKDYVSIRDRTENLYQQTKRNIEETQKKLSQIKERETRFNEELRLELEKMEIKLSQELEGQQKSILRMAQNSIDQELIGFKAKLKKKFLNQVEALCRDSLKNEEQNNHLFAQKLKR